MKYKTWDVWLGSLNCLIQALQGHGGSCGPALGQQIPGCAVHEWLKTPLLLQSVSQEAWCACDGPGWGHKICPVLNSCWHRCAVACTLLCWTEERLRHLWPPEPCCGLSLSSCSPSAAVSLPVPWYCRVDAGCSLLLSMVWRGILFFFFPPSTFLSPWLLFRSTGIFLQPGRSSSGSSRFCQKSVCSSVCSGGPAAWTLQWLLALKSHSVSRTPTLGHPVGFSVTGLTCLWKQLLSVTHFWLYLL